MEGQVLNEKTGQIETNPSVWSILFHDKRVLAGSLTLFCLLGLLTVGFLRSVSVEQKIPAPATIGGQR